MLVTQGGVAVNPRRPELALRLKEAGLDVRPAEELKALAERITGKPRRPALGRRPLARVIGREGFLQDTIYLPES